MMLCDTCFHANTCMNFCVGEGAYETTGCQYYDNAVHICDLLTAEKDGRLVVIPCKVGDTLFVIERDRTVCHNGCKFDEYSCQGCEEERCDSKVTYKIVPRKNQSLMTIALFMQSGCFGKTVFLTRESAETTLGGGSDE